MLLPVIAMVACACYQPLDQERTLQLEEGMSAERVHEVLGLQPKDIMDFEDVLRLYTAARYEVRVGTDTDGLTMSGVSHGKGFTASPHQAGMNPPRKIDVLEDWFLIYEEGALVYWGSHGAMARSANPTLRSIAKRLSR